MVAFNQAFHYDQAEKSLGVSATMVLRATERIFTVIEVFGMEDSETPTLVNLIADLKIDCRVATRSVWRTDGQ